MSKMSEAAAQHDERDTMREEDVSTQQAVRDIWLVLRCHLESDTRVPIGPMRDWSDAISRLDALLASDRGAK